MSSSIGTARRPGVVTFVGIVIYIQAFIALAFGIVAFVERNNAKLSLVTGQSSGDLIVTAIVEVIIALALFAVGTGILSGLKGARLLVAIVMGFRIVVAAWWMITHHAGGFHSAGIVTIGVAVFVLWALYAHKESDEFYEGAL